MDYELAVKQLMESFEKEFRKNVLRAMNSGALSGHEHPMVVSKAVLYITAHSFKPLSDEGKEILHNLEHFV